MLIPCADIIFNIFRGAVKTLLLYFKDQLEDHKATTYKELFTENK